MSDILGVVMNQLLLSCPKALLHLDSVVLLSSQPRVTVTSCSVKKVIRDLDIDRSLVY